MLLQAGATLPALGSFTWLIGLRRLGLTRQDLRYARGRAARTGFGLGASWLGAGTAAAGAADSASSPEAHGWVPRCRDAGRLSATVGKTSLVLAPAALAEEIIFRGLPLVLLARRSGPGHGAGADRVVFAFLPRLQSRRDAAAVWGISRWRESSLALAFYAPGGIWTAFGAHLGWNTTARLPRCAGERRSRSTFRCWIIARATRWLTGGRFGPEGGLAGHDRDHRSPLLATIRWARKEPA